MSWQLLLLVRFVDSIHGLLVRSQGLLVRFMDSILWFYSWLRFISSIFWLHSWLRFLHSVLSFVALIRFIASMLRVIKKSTTRWGKQQWRIKCCNTQAVPKNASFRFDSIRCFACFIEVIACARWFECMIRFMLWLRCFESLIPILHAIHRFDSWICRVKPPIHPTECCTYLRHSLLWALQDVWPRRANPPCGCDCANS